MLLESLTQAQINALTPVNGLEVFNSTTGLAQRVEGGVWKSVNKVDNVAALTLTSPSIVVTTNTTDVSKPINVTSNPVSQSAGSRQGGIYITVDRSASYPFTSWDGNPDCGLKIQAINRAVSGTNGSVRGIDINARNRDAGTLSWLNGAALSITNSANTIQNAIGAQVITDNGGTVAIELDGLIVQDVSQGTAAITNLLRLTTGTINPASGARRSAINFAAKDTVGFTNAFYFENNAGLEGATAASYTTLGNKVGKIAVRVGAATMYLPLYDSIS